MAKEVTVLGIEGAFLRGVRLEERNGAFTCADVASWPLAEEAPDGDAGVSAMGYFLLKKFMSFTEALPFSIA